MKKLMRMCKSIWRKLSSGEKEAYYYDNGIVGFIRDVARLLHIDLEGVDNDALIITTIVDELIKITFDEGE